MVAKHMIVDLRFNPGGDLFNTILFSRALPRLVPRDGRVFVLVGRATSSVAISTAAMLKGSGGDKVTLIGEDMGDDSRFWVEANLSSCRTPALRFGTARNSMTTRQDASSSASATGPRSPLAPAAFPSHRRSRSI